MKEAALEQMATERTIRVHEPFAEFLGGKTELSQFSISLVDCYRMAGHACHAITGAFLVTEAAVSALYPQSGICERGDLSVEFGSDAEEGATGPRSNIISFITGAWAGSGFPGLQGKFKRKGLMRYGISDLHNQSVRFTRISTGERIVVNYDSKRVTASLALDHAFPESWRQEICAVLLNSNEAVEVLKDAPAQTAHQ